MIKTQIFDILQTHKKFAQHPIEEIARLPAWTIRQVVFAQLTVAAISGILSGLIHFGIWKIMQGIFFFPIVALIMNLLLTSFLYYYFQIFENRTHSFIRLQTLVYFSSLPFFLFHIGSFYLSFLDLLGLAMTSMLLIIGLTENFQLAKKRSLRLVGAVFGLLLIVWLVNRLTSYSGY